MKEIMNPFLQSVVACLHRIIIILNNEGRFYSPLMETAADKNDFENYD